MTTAQAPILLFGSYGELDLFASVAEAERAIDPWALADGQLAAADASGRVLRVLAVGPSVRLTDTGASEPEQIRARLAERLREEGELVPPRRARDRALRLPPLARRGDHQPGVGANGAPAKSPWHRASVKPAAREHRQQLGRRVDADGERARLARPVVPDERLRDLGDARDGVEGALLEQQPALADEPPVLLGERSARAGRGA